ncbi:MAG: hypothetical protein QMC90_02295 [Dehalococcoidales bacterium]|nr:hypothetical protein [Dehalococcoidales bacterium]
MALGSAIMGSMNEKESPALEERVAKVEGILEEVRARLNHIESEISELRREIHTNFRWMVGIMFTMWVTIILAIIFTS